MKEKEWKKEQKIPLLPVEFPEDSVMQKELWILLIWQGKNWQKRSLK